MKKPFKDRIFEIIPGLTAWTAITFPLWGGIFFPEITAYFILIFNAFWLYKSLSAVIFFIIGYLKIRNAENADWMGKLDRVQNPESGIKELKQDINNIRNKKFSEEEFNESIHKRIPSFAKKLLFNLEKKKTIRYMKSELDVLQKNKRKALMEWNEIRHVVIIPFWKEPYPVLKRSLDALAKQTFPRKNIIVVLGAEARHPPAYKLAQRLQKKYEKVFAKVWINNHVLSGEDIVGKSANMASCGKAAMKKIEDLGWDKNKITITSCDSDTQFPEQYFAYLSYLFITDPDRYTHFYSAPMVYYANIWKLPFYSRITNTLFSINNIATAARPDKFIQVSSYSFSWKLLEKIDFWSVDIIPEDFHMFFKALFLHGDKVMTVPIFLRNLSDAPEAVGHINIIKNQYEQVKRWAWGASDHGWMIENYFASSKKSAYVFYRVAHTIFDHITWSVISFVLMFGANIPPLVNKQFSMTVFGQKLPKVSSFILTVSTGAFLLSLLIDFFIKPRRKEKISILQFILEQFQWVTFPFVSMFFGAIPGLDAQTRLLFGKYLEYRLTEKH